MSGLRAEMSLWFECSLHPICCEGSDRSLVQIHFVAAEGTPHFVLTLSYTVIQ